MKKDYLVNLNTAIDLIWELGESGKIDRETECLFMSVLYRAREFNFNNNPFKVLPAGESKEPFFNIKDYIQLKTESLKLLFLRVESVGGNFPWVLTSDKIDKIIQSYLKLELDKISAGVLKVREKFIELSDCTDSSEMFEVMRQSK